LLVRADLEQTTIPKVSQNHLDARRQQILDAAVECFSRDGLHPTSMQDIVRQSGLSAGALYTYFKSKDEMITAIAAGRHMREREMIGAAIQDSDTAATLHILVRNFARSLLDPTEQKARRLSIQLWAEALRNPGILKIVREGTDMPRMMLSAMILEARERGDISKQIVPDALARVLIALFQGFALQLALDASTELEPSLQIVEQMLAALSPNTMA
jgi:AcrR family transcriptional regulator